MSNNFASNTPVKNHQIEQLDAIPANDQCTAAPERDLEMEKSFVPKTPPSWILGLAAAVLLISGSYDSIITKMMNRQKVPPCAGCEPVYFEAPFFQTWTMYMGETCCLIAYYIDKWVAKRKNKVAKLDFPTSARSMAKRPCPKYLWLIPSILDFISTSMINYAYVLSQASTIQLLRNFNVVMTALLSLVYIRLALRRHMILGVIVVTIGLVLTGLEGYLHPDTSTNLSDVAWVGILLALIGTLISSFQFVLEESLFRKYRCSPVEAVGWMGVYGVIIGAILLTILELVPFKGVEKTSQTFFMMGYGSRESTIIIICNITFVISVSVFNASSLIVSKLASCLLRTILMASRSFSIWLLELIIGWKPFSGLSFAGMLVILAAVFIYNYNYMFAKDSWVYDSMLRKPVICCDMLRNPDALEEETEQERPRALKSVTSHAQLEAYNESTKN